MQLQPHRPGLNVMSPSLEINIQFVPVSKSKQSRMSERNNEFQLPKSLGKTAWVIIGYNLTKQRKISRLYAERILTAQNM